MSNKSLPLQKPLPREYFNPLFIPTPKSTPSVGGAIYLNSMGDPCGPYEVPFYIVLPSSWPIPQGYHLITPSAAQKFGIGLDAQATQAGAMAQPTESPIVSSQTTEAGGASSPITSSANLQKTIAADPDEGDAEDDRVSVFAGPDGYYAQARKEMKAKSITNWIIVNIVTVHSISLSETSASETRRIEFEIRLYNIGHSMERISATIEYEKFDTICKRVTAIEASAQIFTSDPEKLRALVNLLRHQIASCQHCYEYLTSGWVRFPNGKWAYVNDSVLPPSANVRFRSGFSFLHGPKKRPAAEILEDGFGLLRIANDPVAAAVLFLWAAMSVMFSIFENAGYRPTSLLFIEGITGSLKTATAKLVFNFSGKEDFYTTFRSTSSSMEVQLGNCRDRVLLVDDFCPPADGRASAEMQRTLELIIRYFGDGKARGRTNPQMGKVSEKKVSGLCAITGEDSAGSHSSLLRCLFLPVTRETIDRSVLSVYQAEPWRWTEYLELFTMFLAPRFDDYVTMITQAYPGLRQEAERCLNERRLIDTAVALRITGKTVLDMAAAFGMQGVEQYESHFRDAIYSTCKISETAATRRNPTRMFAEIVFTFLSRGDQRLAFSVNEFETEPDQYLGVVKDSFWYLWPDKTYNAVRLHCTSLGTCFPLRENALWQRLSADGVLIPTPVNRDGKQGYEYGTKVSFAGRPRMLKVDPRVLSQFADSEANPSRP